MKFRMQLELATVSQLLGRTIAISKGVFQLQTGNTYIFQYPEPNETSHQFSKITLSNLVSSGIVIVTENTQPINCDSNHSNHGALELFMRSKNMAAQFFSDTLSSGTLTNPECEEIRLAMEENKKECYPDHSAAYVETTWTRRLYAALTVHCPYLNPQLTMFDANGGGFAKNILKKWATAEMLVNSVFLRGAPDLTTDNQFIDVLSGEDDEDGASDTSPMELATTKLALALGSKMFTSQFTNAFLSI